MDATLLRALLFVTVALGAVLLVRRPVRRAFGAAPAFGLWLLPVLAMALPWLPGLPAHWTVLPAIRALPASIVAAGSDAASSAHGWRWLWLLGAGAMLLRLAVQYLRLRRQGRPLPAALADRLQPVLDGLDPRRLRLHPAGPAVLWAPRSLMLLPPDFMDRHDADARRLVLRHELTHLRRGDALWNLFAELAAALLWFHPLAWLARPRFRLDQELACDERALHDAPHDAAAYAHTLLHSVGVATAPTLIPWLAEPQLKERLTMIQRQRPGALRRRAGHAALAVLMAGSAFVAQAAADNHPVHSIDTNYVPGKSPHYPAAAIKGMVSGTVILRVQVFADGSVGTITYDVQHSTTDSADLIAAATDTVRKWHFQPEMKDGRPIDGYVRVPIQFDVHPFPGKTEDKAEKKAS